MIIEIVRVVLDLSLLFFRYSFNQP